MTPCISQATTLSTTFEADLTAYSRAGWTAVELWLTKLETYLEGQTVQAVKTLLADKGLSPMAAAAQGGLLLSAGAERDAHWEHFRRRLAILQELGVPRLIVTADFNRELVPEDYGRAAQALIEVGALARSHDVAIALEFQKGARFCASLDTTLALIAQSSAEGVGVCLDLFHYYTGPSKLEDFALLKQERLFHVQMSDLAGVPREVATDAQRILPGDGDLALDVIVQALKRIGYDGWVSLELMNPTLWQVRARSVAEIGLAALLRVLGAQAA